MVRALIDASYGVEASEKGRLEGVLDQAHHDAAFHGNCTLLTHDKDPDNPRSTRANPEMNMLDR